ncbi:MAG TPA: hypothetical protein VNT26_01485 [Candidatus Sulfotelmatobacter sp.]|nr:hypothetical protein [Candidatus Sulfotelmatobacter sp.]
MTNLKKRYCRHLVTHSTLALLAAGSAWAAAPAPGGLLMNGPAGFTMGNWGEGTGSAAGPDAAAANFRGQGGPQRYEAFAVDIAQDPFVNPERFRAVSGLAFVDDDGDGICDYFQDTALHRDELGLAWVDRNQDSISDLFQTSQAYGAMGLGNFVDVDGDGLSDNYELSPWGPGGPANFRGGDGPQFYPPFEVATAGDVFVNPGRFARMTGLQFVDENGDGISDYFQNGPAFHQLGIGGWADANEDSIADRFQTREMYWALGMRNFVDVDGDGLCDNYELTPIVAEEIFLGPIPSPKGNS